MKMLLGLSLSITLFALLLSFHLKIGRAAVPAAAQEKFADDNGTALTIYNQNFFVARERVPLDLKPGVNQAEYAGIAAHLEPDSVVLRDPQGRALQVLEQNYRNDAVSPEMLLSFYEGKTIDFVVGRNADGSDVKQKGKIIRSGYVSPNYIQGFPQPASAPAIVEVEGVLRFGLPGQPVFPALSADSILKPTLSWLLETDTPGKFNAEISYVSGGMNWQADYNVVVQSTAGVDARSHPDQPPGKSDLLDMIGWITMRNYSGKTFEDARIKLLAGDVSKIQETGMAGKLMVAESRAVMVDAMAPAVREKPFDEFHLYTLERPTTLRDQETKQVELVRATGIHAQRLFIYDGAQTAAYTDYIPDQIRQDANYGTASNPKVWVMEEFKNSESDHLGLPLPKGRLRFYRRDSDGHLEFVGENVIDHTPKDETVRVYTGNAFDVTGERKRTNYRVESSQRWMDESFEIRIRNHKQESVEVRAVEHLYRWTNWKLSDQSAQSRKTDAQTIEFPVTIAPNGEQVISYTVHYSW